MPAPCPWHLLGYRRGLMLEEPCSLPVSPGASEEGGGNFRNPRTGVLPWSLLKLVFPLLSQFLLLPVSPVTEEMLNASANLGRARAGRLLPLQGIDPSSCHVQFLAKSKQRNQGKHDYLYGNASSDGAGPMFLPAAAKPGSVFDLGRVSGVQHGTITGKDSAVSQHGARHCCWHCP